MIYCGSAHCKGGHYWLTAYHLNAMNCGALRYRSEKELQEVNERYLLEAQKLISDFLKEKGA